MPLFKSKKGSAMINKIIYGGIGLTVLFLLMSTIILTRFNESYNTPVTGLSASTLQGLQLLVLVLALVGFAIGFLPRIRK